jgi:hypothetical protein
VNPLNVKFNAAPATLQGDNLERFDATLRGILLNSAKSG